MQTEKKNNIAQFIFLTIGGALVIISFLAGRGQDPDTPWKVFADIALNIGVTVLAVSIIDWLWRRTGGDPLMNAIDELRDATTLLADLRDTGLKRLFVSREQANLRKKVTRDKIAQASKVDMLGIVLRSGWMSEPGFQTLLSKRAKTGETSFRIMILDPDAEVTKQREREEDRKASQRISRTANETLSILHGIKQQLPQDKQDHIEIKVIDETNIYCSIIRVDELMLVTNYLMHLSGGNSETMEIEGDGSTLFELYENEFETMWSRAAYWPKSSAQP